MTLIPASHFSTGGTPEFEYADASTDPFRREHISEVARMLDDHDHTSGRGKPVSGAAAGSIGTTALAANAVTDDILEDHVTDDNNRAVGPDHIKSNAVIRRTIADDAVGPDELADGNDAADANRAVGHDHVKLQSIHGGPAVTSNILIRSVTFDNMAQAFGATLENHLVNPSFESWKHGGTGPFVGANPGIYGPDMWIVYSPVTLSVQQVTAGLNVFTGSFQAMRAIQSGSSQSLIYQWLEDNVSYRGGPLSFGMWVRAGAANAVRIGIQELVGVPNILYSPYHSGGDTWEFLSVTLDISGVAQRIRAVLSIENTSTSYFDHGMLTTTNVPFYYYPAPAGIDAVRIDRYYQILGGGIRGVAGAVSEIYENWLAFRTPMAAQPTITRDGSSPALINGALTFPQDGSATLRNLGARFTFTAAGAGAFAALNQIIRANAFPTVNFGNAHGSADVSP